VGHQLFTLFTATNGVRQGEVLNLYLFAVYLDELSDQLGSARVGCTVGNMFVNYLIFADDRQTILVYFAWPTKRPGGHQSQLTMGQSLYAYSAVTAAIRKGQTQL